MRLLLISTLALASCSEENSDSRDSQPEEPGPDAITQKIAPKKATAVTQKLLPKFIPDLESEALTFYKAWWKHNSLTPEKQQELNKFDELRIKAMTIDTEAAQKICVKYCPPLLCAHFPSVETFVGMLERDEDLQSLTAAINNPAKNKDKITRNELHEARERYLEKRLQNFVKSLPMDNNRYKEGSEALLKFINSQ